MPRLLTFLLIVLACTLPASAQTRVLAPHKPIAPRVEKPIKDLVHATQRSMFGGLWMTDVNLKASIYLRNVVETDSVTVTPVLHLSNAAQYTLPDVTVKPSGVAIISINDGLQSMGISGSATLSGYVELLYTWPWDPFCATVRNVDTAHSLIFTYALRPTMPLSELHITDPKPTNSSHTIEGMWWKQEKNVVGFVTVANLSADPADTTVEVTDSQAAAVGQHTFTVSPHGMKFIQLPELQETGATQGGIRITSSQGMDRLVVNGGLEDVDVGYSAQMQFSMNPIETSPTQISIAELGLMAGAADPMMLFPAGTTFTPYSVLRNVSDSPLTVAPTVWWMAAATPHSAQLPPITLLPYETRSLDVMSSLSQAGLVSATKSFNGSFNLVFDGNFKAGALLMSSGSVDQTNTYVFEVIPRGVTEGASKSLQYWSTGNGEDTMVTLWNPADEAQDFILKLFFEIPGGTGGHYALPIHLGPRETRNLNVSEVVHNQFPDAEGNLIPVSVHEGSIRIQGSHDEAEHILLAVDSGIYNVRKATCWNSCQECDGYVASTVVLSSFSVGVQGTNALNLVGTWNTGGQRNIAASWSSNHTPIMTVNTAGLATGVSAGTAIIVGLSGYEPIGVGNICTGGGYMCPTQTFGGSSSGCVGSLTFNGTANNFIFVGTDSNVLSKNTYFLQLASGTSTGGTYAGTSSDASDTVTLTDFAGMKKATIKTTDQSTASGDRTLTFTYTPPSCGPLTLTLHVTARKFFYLTDNSPSNICTLGYGTDRNYVYTVHTHPDGGAIDGSIGDWSGTPATENFNPSPTCATITGDGALDSNGQLHDHVSSACSSQPLTCNQTSTQTLGITGITVRTNTLQWSSTGVSLTNPQPTQ